MPDVSEVWEYDTSEAIADPGSGKLRSGPDPIVALAISIHTKGGTDLGAALLTLTSGDRLAIQEVSDATSYAVFDLTADAIDQTTWVEFAVEVVAIPEAPTPPTKNTDLLVLANHVPTTSDGHAYATSGELARILRLRAPTPEQTTAMDRVLAAAAVEIDSEVGRGSAFGTPYPSLVVEVNLERAVEHWQQQESPFGIIGLGDAVPVATARDSWDRHAMKLAPLKQTWGIG